jgi:hypothetical protein
MASAAGPPPQGSLNDRDIPFSVSVIGAAVGIWLVRSVVRPISSLLAIFVRDKSA